MSGNSLTVEQSEVRSEYFPSCTSIITESDDFQQPIQPTPHSLIQEKAAQDFLVTFSEIMNRLATDTDPNLQSTSGITPPTRNEYYYSNNTDLIENPTHPIKSKTPMPDDHPSPPNKQEDERPLPHYLKYCAFI